MTSEHGALLILWAAITVLGVTITTLRWVISRPHGVGVLGVLIGVWLVWPACLAVWLAWQPVAAARRVLQDRDHSGADS